MKLVRNSIFETNSSSTHSLVIYKREMPDFEDIPRNIKSYAVDEYGVAYGSDESASIHRIESERDKLAFMLNVCATICERRYYDRKMFASYSWDDRSNSPDEYEYLSRYWEEMINSDIFTALKNVVYEVTGTSIEFKKPNNLCKGIPFYESLHLDDEDIEEMFHISDESSIEEFKEFIRDVIFNKDIIIKDSNIPYGYEGIFD